MKFPTFAICAAAALSACAFPEIREDSVEMTQDKGSHVVTISYTLDNDPAIVTVDIFTNGVPLTGALLQGRLAGEINKKVAAGKHTIVWKPSADPRISGVKDWAGEAKAVVTAWPTNSPPTWMVVDLTAANSVEFYADESWFPEDMTNDTYKTDKLVMRKIPAKGVIWRTGAANAVGNGSYAELGMAGEGATPHERARPVVLSSDYYMGIFEVTQGQYKKFMSVPSDIAQGDTLPVAKISLMTAIRGANPAYFWPTQGHSVDPNLFLGRLRTHSGGIEFDIPTEAQWEIACRAGEGAAFNNGCWFWTNSTDVAKIAWTSENSGGTMHPVGLLNPNRWGLYDMHGNVCEWTLDIEHSTWNGGFENVTDEQKAQFLEYANNFELIIDPAGSPVSRKGKTDGGESSFVKGGRFNATAQSARSASRQNMVRTYTLNYLGFRLCCPAALP